MDVYSIGGDQYIIDGASVDAAEEAIRALEVQFGLRSPSMNGIDLPPDDGGTNDVGGGDYGGGGTNAVFSYPSNALYLEITGVLSNTVFLNIHGTTEDVLYEIESRTNLVAGADAWVSAGLVNGLQDLTPTTVPAGVGTNCLFLRAKSYVDDDGNGLPDWWELTYFGTNGIDPYADLAGDGWTVLRKYELGLAPTNYCMPPPPQGVAAKLDSAGTNVVITWTSGGGPVASYEIYALEYDDWNGWQSWDIGPASATDCSFADPVQRYDDGSTWFCQYVVRANFTGGGHVDSQPSPPIGGALNSTVLAVRGPGGDPYLVVGSVPPSLAFVRLYWQTWDEQNGYMNRSVDVPASSLVNGVTRLPIEQMPGYLPEGLTKGQCFGSDGSVGSAFYLFAYPSSWMSHAQGFADARRHMKENLEFLLRSATATMPFRYAAGLTVSGESLDWPDPSELQQPEIYFAREASPADYEYYGFHTFSPTLNYSFLQELRPVQDNFVWRNFLFDPQAWSQIQPWPDPYDFDAQGRRYRFLSSLQYAYTGSGAESPLPVALTNVTAQWSYNYCINHSDILLYGFPYQPVIEAGCVTNSSGEVFVASGGRNCYGLSLNSLRLDWANGLVFQPSADTGQPDLTKDSFYFLNCETPQLSIDGYYFASQYSAADSGSAWSGTPPPLPGSPSFSITNSSPPIITPLGRPIPVSGWARMAITNGYAGKFAFLEQYFDKAYKMDDSGNVTTNETGVLSPYGEFLPTDAGQIALVTMPDIDTGQRGTGVVNVIKLQLDVNHDGVMDTSFAGPDNTSPSQPFVFWVNNDCDWETTASDPGKDLDIPDPDCSGLAIRSPRDLEDYARLWICGVPALTNGDYQVTLSWGTVGSGHPSIRLFNAVETNGGIAYLTNVSTAAQQSGVHGTSFGQFYQVAAISSTPLWDAPASFTFPSVFFTNAANKYFLFEGWTNGCGELVLSIKQNGQTIAQTSAWLDLHDVKDFYERMVISNNVSGAISNWTSGIETVQSASSSALGDDKELIVLVHGINVGVSDWLIESDTVFKRLYWAGYHGKFATVKWQCNFLTPPKPVTLDVFNLSEAKAYKDSTALVTYLNQLHDRFPDHRLHLLVHSQGNAVVSEALARSGVPVDTYILTQGAIAASAYDADTPIYQPFVDKEVGTGITPEWQPWGYRGIYTNLTGRIVNFYNPQDKVLEIWKEDQIDAKPPQSWYSYDGANCWYTDFFFRTTLVTDSEETRAMVARARTIAIGQSGPASGHGVIQSAVDLSARFGFFNIVDEHSAQWNRPIQTSRPYFQQVLTSCQLVPAP